jgi:hypothetical protein
MIANLNNRCGFWYDHYMKTRNLNLKVKSFAFLFVFLVTIFYLLTLNKAHAQIPKGITVYPSIIHIDLAQDKPEYDLTYINNTGADIGLKLNVQDFTELEDSYKISFLTSKDAANYKYSLSSWIYFENNNLFLANGEKRSVKVFIDKNRITKGGHYASILAEIIQPETKNQIAIKAVLSSLLFVRASTGKEIENGKISDFTVLKDGIEYPDTYQISFQNNGNVHIVPYGQIQVFDPLSNLVAKGPFNVNSMDALPESIRNYETKVVTYQKLLFPGIYTAKVDLFFGKTNQKATATIKFFSQGMFDFAKIGLGILLLIILSIYLRRKFTNKPPLTS